MHNHNRIIIMLMVTWMVLNITGCGEPISEHNKIAKSMAPVISTKVADFGSEEAAHFVQLALDCASQEYPNKIGHTMKSDADQGTPRSLHPAFYGCFDWHSSVHGHWLLARFARLYPDHPLAFEAQQVLADHFTPELVNAEVEYLLADGRSSWERPYGLAWLLQLAGELREWAGEGNSEAANWSQALAPLEVACVERLENWLPKLAYPIRTGEHSQTAFAFGLMLDYAHVVGNTSLDQLVQSTSLRLYGSDANSNLAYEPSGQDFLSPILAEADLMRRIMEPWDFAAWLRVFLVSVPFDGTDNWLPVAAVTDRSDGKLAHLDGLNLSRAWMLEGMASGLPANDSRRAALVSAARAHRRTGLAAVTGEHYAGGHWLGTYAMYLSTSRGLD